MAWQRLDESKIRNVGGLGVTLAWRAYGQGGSPWPRLVIGVKHHFVYVVEYDDRPLEITSAIKRGPGAPWADYGLPSALLGDVVEMIRLVSGGACPAHG